MVAGPSNVPQPYTDIIIKQSRGSLDNHRDDNLIVFPDDNSCVLVYSIREHGKTMEPLDLNL